MTSLIDVIFLLLLFFMLTSTFSKFAEVELSAAGAGAVASPDAPPLFMQLGADDVRLNGDPVALDALGLSPLAKAEQGTTLLVSLGTEVDSQRLTDLLVALRRLPALRVTVLGG
ncbi:biopolymer transporter ExbD [Sulfitobacter sp. M57]|nr:MULTISPECIES: biopolymer transporter ExbD [unclassified Sulfitobacter]MDF3415100.1 biopolymer transporter ExbD [Sulfitobacter sp. KE5]MDF3422581.1 biopolymer transporter ExbD [Sulfitobacter sp. KE43]MDF3433646.1 biopolymer transporter ExbD [Sulfitobacter sp. KE42]MDF3459286.1 biopolymer transporter ExbD [Sulfitobacter sp. S74]MDF3463185.1 biopolymer transporter ExbD [Sulfitobacter sp. Ks18]